MNNAVASLIATTLIACGSPVVHVGGGERETPPTVDAGTDAPAPPIRDTGVIDSGPPSPEVVRVSIKWVYFDLTYPCQTFPVDLTFQCMNKAATCPFASECAPPKVATFCVQATWVSACCADSASINASDLPRLVADYPQCVLTQSSPFTYALECPTNPHTNVYLVSGARPLIGGDTRFTDDRECKWSPPYALGSQRDQ